MIINLPNLLTLSRIASGPLLGVAIAYNAVWISLVLLTVAMISDFYDGRLARRYGSVTKTGAFLDPLADKVLIISGFAALCYAHVIPVWVVAVIVGRDICVTVLRSVLLARGYELQTSWFAKSKTALQFIALYLYIVGNGYLHGSFGYVGFSFKLVMYRMIEMTSVVIAVITVLSGLAYTWKIKRRVSSFGGSNEDA